MNVRAAIRADGEDLWRERKFRAIVTGTSGNLVTIQRVGQGSPDPQSYPRFASYSSPTAGDEVVVEWLDGGYYVSGEILR